jgi:trehalose 6-phosphate synthase/phosphatase
MASLLKKGPETSREIQVQRDLDYIYVRTAYDWVQRFLTDLKRAHKDTKNLLYMFHGLGDSLKLIALKNDFEKLSKARVLDAYNNSSNRVFFFDNEGTLSNFMKQTEIDKKVGPSNRILKALFQLCDEENNTVYVITGRTKDVVHNWFKSVPTLGMAAEYGAVIKHYDSCSWQHLYKPGSNWKETAKEIISVYTERTEGSLLVEKESAVVFLYREADAEFGAYQAKELVNHLDFLLRPFMDEIEISEGMGYVEVKPRGINKGTALHRAMEKVFENKGPIDFILAVGDDNADEDMFKMVRLLAKHNSRLLVNRKVSAFTCTLGMKPSSAKYYLLDATKVVNLLEHINGESKKKKRNFSDDDLRTRRMREVEKKLRMAKIERLEESEEEEWKTETVE